MMTSPVASVKFIKTKVIFRYRTKGVSNQVRITKSKVIHVQIPVPKWEKTKSGKKIFWLTKRGNKVIKNWGRF